MARLCDQCGAPLGESVEWGPLRVRDDPLIAFWRGLRIGGLRPMQLRLLLTLARRGAASHFALQMHLGENTCPRTLHVHFCLMRKALRQAAIPLGIRSTADKWGYELYLTEVLSADQ